MPMNKPLEEQRCDNCRYRMLRTFRKTALDLSETQEIAYFECRRNAPHSSAKQRVAAFWPIVDDDDWCGEWVQR